MSYTMLFIRLDLERGSGGSNCMHDCAGTGACNFAWQCILKVRHRLPHQRRQEEAAPGRHRRRSRQWNQRCSAYSPQNIPLHYRGTDFLVKTWISLHSSAMYMYHVTAQVSLHRRLMSNRQRRSRSTPAPSHDVSHPSLDLDLPKAQVRSRARF
jgi:hypothetical protein